MTDTRAAPRAARLLVYGAGLAQGLALVSFPAASSILTSPTGYDLSTAQYGLMFLPQVVLAITAAAYPILLCATAALGFGFGSTVPALNTFAEHLDPARQDRSVLTLNALLGTGTALAPLLIALFLALGAWWLLPVLAAATSSGELIAGYQVGYGITAFGVAPLQSLTGIGMSGIYLIGAGIAVALAVVARMVTAGRARHPATP